MKCKYQTEMLKWNNLPAHRKKGTLVMQAALGYLRGMMGKGEAALLTGYHSASLRKKELWRGQEPWEVLGLGQIGRHLKRPEPGRPGTDEVQNQKPNGQTARTRASEASTEPEGWVCERVWTLQACSSLHKQRPRVPGLHDHEFNSPALEESVYTVK